MSHVSNMVEVNEVEAVILAGGLGTRLRSVVAELPKCMAPVAGRPFIDFVMEALMAQGIQRFILALGYRSEAIVEHVQKTYPQLQIKYSIEDEPLGTGGAIRRALSLAHSSAAVVANGDTLFPVDLKKGLQLLADNNADCVLHLKPMENFDRYGVVELNDQKAITAFQEKKHYEQGLINGGVYLMNVPAFLNENLPTKFSFEKEYLEALFTKRKMYGEVQDAYFIDIGIPADFERAQIELR